MNEKLTAICCVKWILGALSYNKWLLALGPLRTPYCVGKDLKEMNVDSVITPDGCTKYIQPPDVCWNKPFKARMTELYDQWLSESAHQFTEDGNMKPTSRKRITEWVLDSLSHQFEENIIKSFKC